MGVVGVDEVLCLEVVEVDERCADAVVAAEEGEDDVCLVVDGACRCTGGREGCREGCGRGAGEEGAVEEVYGGGAGGGGESSGGDEGREVGRPEGGVFEGGCWAARAEDGGAAVEEF